MVTPLARATIALAAVAGLVASLVGGSFAAAVFAAATVLIPVALIALGAARCGRLGRPLAWVLAAVTLLLGASLAALFLVRGAAATAVLFAGVWLVPLFLVGLGYALTFDRHGLTVEDLERLREVVGGADRALRDAGRGPASQGYGGGRGADGDTGSEGEP